MILMHSVVLVTGIDLLDSPVALSRLLGLVVPVLVALVSTRIANRKIKTGLNLALSALAGIVGTLVASDGGWAWTNFINAWINAFVVSVVTYYGALKPSGAAGSLADIAPNVGIGEKMDKDIVLHDEDFDHETPPVDAGDEVGDIEPIPEDYPVPDGEQVDQPDREPETVIGEPVIHPDAADAAAGDPEPQERP